MKLLIDTNIILDVLCKRIDFYECSSKILKLCEVGKVNGIISALSVPNIIYILRKELTPQKTADVINRLSLILEIADLTSDDLKKAAAMSFYDYEDALQMVCAERIKADYIITRNIKDFNLSTVPVSEPSEFLKKVLI